jgi:hypothetical protein
MTLLQFLTSLVCLSLVSRPGRLLGLPKPLRNKYSRFLSSELKRLDYKPDLFISCNAEVANVWNTPTLL